MVSARMTPQRRVAAETARADSHLLESRDSAKTLGMAWRQNRTARGWLASILEGQQQQPFFFVDGAAANQWSARQIAGTPRAGWQRWAADRGSTSYSNFRRP
jgi:hypothetical protein